MPRKMYTRICPGCGQSFETRDRRQRFCNRACYDACRAEDKKKASPKQAIVTCAYCGKSFPKWKYRIRPDKENYCSRACASHSRQSPDQWTQCICEICEKEFTVQTWFLENRKDDGAGRYCSKECQAEAFSQNRRRENNPNWQGGHDDDYGPNWEAQKRKARKRDKYRCRACGKKPKSVNLHVHHIVPFREFGYVPGENDNYLEANELQNLICLCRSCHGQAEHGNISLQPVLL